MADWFFIALAAYLLLAATGIMDKFLVSKVVRQPIVYAFYTAATGPISLLLAPFGMRWLSGVEYVAAFVSGVSLICAIYFLYSAFGQASVSRVIPVQGGLVPFFTLIFAYLLLGERLSMVQNFAFIFLVFGAVLITVRKEHGSWKLKALRDSALAAMFMALSSVMTKYVFEHSNFISGMVWTRLGFIFVAMAIIAFKKNRDLIFKAPKEAGAKNVGLYYSSRVTGSVAGFLQNYAVSLGSVTIVNALQGMQFVFLLALTTFFSFKYPKVLKEKISANIIALKITAIILITCGLVLLKA
jgi:drug/metabolite transporter (DMT)-like permease